MQIRRLHLQFVTDFNELITFSTCPSGFATYVEAGRPPTSNTSTYNDKNASLGRKSIS